MRAITDDEIGTTAARGIREEHRLFRSDAMRDLLVMGITGGLLLLVAVRVDLFEITVAWTRRYESIELDELIIVLATLAVLAGAFCVRRWRDSYREARWRRGLITAAMDGFILADVHGRIREANPAYARMAGYTRNELLTMSIADVEAVETPRVIEQRIRELLDRGEAAFETKHWRRDGRTIDLQVSATLLPWRGEDLIAAFVRDTTERNRLKEDLEKTATDLRDLVHRLQTIREEERIALSRDLHDELGQALTAMRLDCARLRSQFSPDDDEAQVTVEALDALVMKIIGDVRRISRGLRPAILDDLGLAPAIHEEAAAFEERSGIQCETRFPAQPELEGLGEAETIAMFRIAQEALTNVARHAEASRVMIFIERRERSVALQIVDDGKGFRNGLEEGAGRLGVLGMQERARAVGGDLTILGTAGLGTKLTAVVPVVQEAAPRAIP